MDLKRRFCHHCYDRTATLVFDVRGSQGVDLLQAFDVAARNYSIRGACHPDDRAGIVEDYRVARARLLKCIWKK